MNPGDAANLDPLADLRGYHLPEPVAWWPPAPGWWLLILLALGVVLVGAWWLVNRQRRRRAARRALEELSALNSVLQRDGDASAFVRGLSRLLRRFALARFPRQQVAGLVGPSWLDFLDAHGGRFREGPGRLLAEVPYRRPDAEIPTAALAALAEEWIERNQEPRT